MAELTKIPKTKTTHLERQNKRYQAIRDELLGILRISQETYYQWLFDSGLSYLARVFTGMDHLGKLMSRSEKFWKWWKNQYRILDEELINEFMEVNQVDEIGLIKLREYYNNRHSNTKVFLESYLYEVLSSQVKKEKVAE